MVFGERRRLNFLTTITTTNNYCLDLPIDGDRNVEWKYILNLDKHLLQVFCQNGTMCVGEFDIDNLPETFEEFETICNTINPVLFGQVIKKWTETKQRIEACIVVRRNHRLKVIQEALVKTEEANLGLIKCSIYVQRILDQLSNVSSISASTPLSAIPQVDRLFAELDNKLVERLCATEPTTIAQILFNYTPEIDNYLNSIIDEQANL